MAGGFGPVPYSHQQQRVSYGVWRRWRAPPAAIGETDGMDAAWIA